jgi:hypothetical protein
LAVVTSLSYTPPGYKKHSSQNTEKPTCAHGRFKNRFFVANADFESGDDGNGYVRRLYFFGHLCATQP